MRAETFRERASLRGLALLAAIASVVGIILAIVLAPLPGGACFILTLAASLAVLVGNRERGA